MKRLGGPLGLFGGLLDLAGVGLIVLGFTGPSATRLTLIGGGIVVCLLGVALVLAGHANPAGTTERAVSIDDPLEAMGRIVALRPGGRTRAAGPATFAATVEVERGDMMPYTADVTVLIDRSDQQLVEVGDRVPIIVDRNDPDRLAFDPSRKIRRRS